METLVWNEDKKPIHHHHDETNDSTDGSSKGVIMLYSTMLTAPQLNTDTLHTAYLDVGNKVDLDLDVASSGWISLQ